MKLGIISDAHGNLIGTKKCLEFLISKRVDHLFFLGDAVGYYPDAIPTLDLLVDLGVSMLKGNHDAMMLGDLAYDPSKETVYRLNGLKSLIGDENLQLISNLAPMKELEFDGRSLLLVHGSPFDPMLGYVYPDSDLSVFEEMSYDCVFMGHTHLPFISSNVVNVGSCGLPRDVGNLSSCCIYDSEKNKSKIFRIPIDRDLLRREYCTRVHSTVMECLDRESEVYNGELIYE